MKTCLIGRSFLLVQNILLYWTHPSGHPVCYIDNRHHKDLPQADRLFANAATASPAALGGVLHCVLRPQVGNGRGSNPPAVVIRPLIFADGQHTTRFRPGCWSPLRNYRRRTCQISSTREKTCSFSLLLLSANRFF
jgi:hypothetical protein